MVALGKPTGPDKAMGDVVHSCPELFTSHLIESNSHTLFPDEIRQS
jgi:hypothetical protein